MAFWCLALGSLQNSGLPETEKGTQVASRPPKVFVRLGAASCCETPVPGSRHLCPRGVLVRKTCGKWPEKGWATSSILPLFNVGI